VRSIRSSSLVAAGFGTTLSQVAGFHWAVPSTTLDKASMLFLFILLLFRYMSTVFLIFHGNLFTIPLWTFCFQTGIMYSGDE